MLVDCHRLSCERGGRLLFDNLSITVSAGDLVELRGPNGSGKSTLLRALAGLYPDIDGEVEIVPATYFGHRLGLSPLLSALENLTWFVGIDSEAARGSGGSSAVSSEIEAALERVGIRSPRRSVGELSAGQQRRVALARLLLSARPLWLLDEPLTALDSDAIELVGELLCEHTASGGGVLCATHQDLPVASTARLDLGEQS